MNRRVFLHSSLAAMAAAPLFGDLRQDRLEAAASVLEDWTADGRVAAASMHVEQGQQSFSRRFGQAASNDAMFLLGSISKPVCVAALMRLFDEGKFQLDDPLHKHLPDFTGEGREQVTLRHVLTHVSGLPDQLANNAELRRSHAPLEEFVKHAIRTPIEFTPGARYQYSSMGILLATHVAEKLSGAGIVELVEKTVLQPLGMKHSAQGLGNFKLEDMVAVQTEHAAPESGAGDPAAREWDWNSPYWRKLGAPWGTTHASAPDVARFLGEFLFARGAVVKPDTARLMTRNHNPQGITPRGLAFNLGPATSSPGCSDQTFGHTGSTGTIAWADPATQTICVVLTSLPARAVSPHPRELTSAAVAAASK
jgi:CubicO group peptidase (beta-lactamase class C family)